MWETLAPAWRACLEEAWAAACAGSLPIGAAVTDPAGRVVARGRNSLWDAGGAPVHRHELAHAELNALLAFDVLGHDPAFDFHLYTTMEPCPLCVGAFSMSTLRHLHYAAPDPYAGSVALISLSPYLSRKPFKIAPPTDERLEAVCAGLMLADFLKDGNPRLRAWVDEHWRPVLPEAVRLGERLAAAGLLRDLQASHAPAQEMVTTVSRLLDGPQP
jgi:tRNA(Arg) A34 adenosine deaminase TadA